ncbi:MAG: SDR family oxidoreductase [Lysobacterales bacterium]|nr:MAG: SDR family oxidoreductase [Xanthomonadales bacterium]RPH94368.1 MAG: SDR family oxidoreductase [Xanthomonadales bacterium]
MSTEAGVRSWRLDGARALVTGASSGIGLATARELAALGADLLLVARGAERLEQARAAIESEFPGRRVEAVAADLASAEDRQRVRDAAGPALQILVNNAGTNIRKRMTELSLEEYRLVQRTNVESCFDLCRLLHPALRQGAPSAVVNNASVAGITHLRTGAPYGMSKAAMIQLTRNLAVEWAAEGIRVNAVAPWYIRTPLADQVLRDPDYRREVLQRTPMGRVGEVEECARAIAFLCMPAAGYITGQCLAIDGGFSVYGF